MAKQRFRINGKFVSFKEFIKFYGLDSVVYSQLDKKQKKIWTGLDTYSKRITDPKTGRFIDNKNFLNNPTLKKFAKNNGMSVKDYVRENYDVIKAFSDNGNFPRAVNVERLKGFIMGHTGKIYRLKHGTKEIIEVEKLDFLFWSDEIVIQEKARGAFNILFHFEIRNIGRDCVYIKYEALYSEDPNKDEDEDDVDDERKGPFKMKGTIRKQAKPKKNEKK